MYRSGSLPATLTPPTPPATALGCTQAIQLAPPWASGVRSERLAVRKVANMADEQQLAVLRQGSDVWNAWRKQNPELRADLAWTNLSGANLSGANLRANFSGTDL